MDKSHKSWQILFRLVSLLLQSQNNKINHLSVYHSFHKQNQPLFPTEQGICCSSFKFSPWNFLVQSRVYKVSSEFLTPKIRNNFATRRRIFSWRFTICFLICCDYIFPPPGKSRFFQWLVHWLQNKARYSRGGHTYGWPYIGEPPPGMTQQGLCYVEVFFRNLNSFGPSPRQ